MKFMIPVIAALFLTGCNKEEEISFCDESEICGAVVFPNPTEGPVTMEFQSDLIQLLEVSVLNLHGGIELKTDCQVKKGENQVILDLSVLKDGIYLLILKDKSDSLKVHFRVVKQH